ncbi:MAG: DUF2203 family protein [Verrucomicrobiota bacterium]
MPQRLFTRHSASRVLPLVSRIVADIEEAERAKTQARLFGEIGRSLFEEMLGKLHELHSELEELGCYYTCANGRDGRVEFPASSGESNSFFCWKPGERTVNTLWEAKKDSLNCDFFAPVCDSHGGGKPSPDKQSTESRTSERKIPRIRNH